MPIEIARLVPKTWGYAVCVKDSDLVDVWFAHAKAGGYSSRHRHPVKANEFLVLSGLLLVEYWRTDRPTGPPTGECQLRAGQSFVVMAGGWHRFVAQRDTDLIETYRHPPDTPLIDIERFDEGGVGTPPY